MKCLILAAGYATRMFPLTENTPKPLLPVGGKPIIDWLIEDIATSDKIDEFVVITNHRFAENFQTWAQNRKENIKILDDKTNSNETRLGAVCDIQFAIDTLDIKDDLLIMAGDNVLSFSLKRFLDFAEEVNTSCVMRYYEKFISRLSKCGVLTIDQENKITGMEEKPQVPKSHWCCPPFYFIKKEDIKKIKEAIIGDCKTDSPGSLIAFLCTTTPFYAMEMPGIRFDVGNIENYEIISRQYKGIIC